MMRLTHRCPVTGSVHCRKIFGLPFCVRACSTASRPTSAGMRTQRTYGQLASAWVEAPGQAATHLGHVLHGDDDTLAAGDQVHRAAHPLDHLALPAAMRGAASQIRDVRDQ